VHANDRYDPGFRRALLDRTPDLLSLNASEFSEIAFRLDLPLLRDFDTLEVVRQIHTNVEVAAPPGLARRLRRRLNLSELRSQLVIPPAEARRRRPGPSVQRPSAAAFESSTRCKSLLLSDRGGWQLSDRHGWQLHAEAERLAISGMSSGLSSGAPSGLSSKPSSGLSSGASGKPSSVALRALRRPSAEGSREQATLRHLVSGAAGMQRAHKGASRPVVARS
jgi:hypothetical protein